MSYTLCTYNGNCGNEITFETYEEARNAYEEAKREGDIFWNSLSASDRRRYTDRDAGAYFCILENNELGDAIRTAYDYADELEE